MGKVNQLASGLSGRDYYAGLFSESLEHEAEWLKETASHKIDSARILIERNHVRPTKIMEVGAGTGAVLLGLKDAGVGERFFATDFSPEAINYLAAQSPDISTAVADVVETPDPFDEGPYDVVLASHVIEHLEEPERFLGALRNVPATWLVAEVPLENLPLGRLKARFSDRSKHPAGHVQFFDRRSFVDLLARSGWEVVDVRTYSPTLTDSAFDLAYGYSSSIRRLHKRLTERILPTILDPVWRRFYHAHCTALCRRKAEPKTS
jgi:hypothetical protein